MAAELREQGGRKGAKEGRVVMEREAETTITELEESEIVTAAPQTSQTVFSDTVGFLIQILCLILEYVMNSGPYDGTPNTGCACLSM